MAQGGLTAVSQALLLGHPRRLIRDTARYPPLMRASAPGRRPKPRALRHLALEHLGLTIQVLPACMSAQSNIACDHSHKDGPVCAGRRALACGRCARCAVPVPQAPQGAGKACSHARLWSCLPQHVSK